MKQYIFFVAILGISNTNAVQFKNNTGTQYTIISGRKCIILDNDQGAFLELRNGNSFIAENGNKKMAFTLTSREPEIELIVLQTDYNHELYAYTQGKEGKPDYRENPVIIP